MRETTLRSSASAAATAAALLLLVAGCAQPPAAPPAPPRSYVVLLPDADGGTGRAVVTGPQGTVELSQARQAAPTDGNAARAFTVAEPQLAADFGAALAARPKPPRTFVLYFELGGTQLTPASQAQMNDIFDEVRSRPAPDLSVVGHTDTAGAAAANETLAQSRADFVARLLKPAAASGLQIEVTSHGERNLLVPTPDDTPEPRNRRVEVTVR